MSIKVGINGFGRIGRMVLRCALHRASYTFPYLTHVSGISRGHSVTLLTDEKGIVTGSRCSNESSNLFGFLFFYSDILSLNVYEPQGTLLIEPGTDTDNSGSIIEGIYMYVLYTIPAAILLFVILWGVIYPFNFNSKHRFHSII